ncbi:hypothetical protein Pla52o_41730 [Novipirellula galeiformis]|uniref:Uncharacterized protein n=1 Tax=Novipirellula galeiformis TaxID=2528004 RepID=A0A5C6CEA6_9BACT|nr:hypothetical protein Pla52o_41730 [Novipirellula galeiformis]
MNTDSGNTDSAESAIVHAPQPNIVLVKPRMDGKRVSLQRVFLNDSQMGVIFETDRC